MTLLLILISAWAAFRYLKLNIDDQKLVSRSDVWKSKKPEAVYRKKIEPLPKLRVW
jgi:hypothetical protein